MGGFIPAISAISSVFNGEQQGQQAAAAYKQQVQQRQLQQQLENAMNLGKLEDYNRALAARGKLAPDEQQILDLGGTMADITKRRDQRTQAGSFADQLYQRALDPSLTPEQRLQAATLSSNLRAHPELIGTIAPEMKMLGIGEKTPAPPFKTFSADGRVKAYTGIDPTTGKPKITDEGATPTASKTSVHWANESDDKGDRVIVKYTTDAAGNVVNKSVEGRGTLAPQEKRLLESADSAQMLMAKLRSDIEPIKNATPTQLMIQYGKYRAPFGIARTVDPAFATYFNDLGQLQTDLVGAATSGSSRAFALIDMLKPHIPSPMDPPARALEKANGFEEGRFKSIRSAILGNSVTGTVVSGGPVSAGAPNTGAGGPPPGARTATGPDGKKYYWDGTKLVPY